MSSLGNAFAGARVLDLFAGSGALGIEALSRGAAHAVFVEHDRSSARTISENLAALGIAGQGTVVVRTAGAFLKSAEAAQFDLILADPPYAEPLDAAFLDALARTLAPGGTLVLERGRDATASHIEGLPPGRERRYGDTRVLVYDNSAKASPSMPTTAIYPGSFDPLTNGHTDIVQRGLKTFDRVILAVANNVQKSALFSVAERVALARQCLGHLPGVEVDTFDGLVVDYAKRKHVTVLLRGLRAVSDFEYEFQLASMNRKLNRDVETVFMMTSEESFYLSSRLVREVASFGGNIEGMVPEPVRHALLQRFSTPPGGPGAGRT